MYAYFLLYVYLFYMLTNWYSNTRLTFSLNLADFLVAFLFIMPVTTISPMLFLIFGI